jgi:choline kinase
LCEEGLAICKSKYSNIFNEQVDCFDIDAHVVFNRQYEDPDRTKALLRVTFASLKNLLFENHGLIDQQEQSKMEVTILK